MLTLFHLQMFLKCWKTEICRPLVYWIMTRGWHIPSPLIRRLTHSLVKATVRNINFPIVFWRFSFDNNAFPCRWNVYIWLFTYTPVYNIQSDFQGWFHEWSGANNISRPYHDAWLCHNWKLCNYNGPAFVLPTKGKGLIPLLMY